MTITVHGHFRTHAHVPAWPYRRPAASGRALAPRAVRPAPEARWVALQIVGVLAGVAAYFGVRGLTEGRSGTAIHHADWIITGERALHLHQEPALQHLVVGHPDITRVLNWIYIFGHWPVIAVTLVWLLLRHDDVYRRVRAAMLISGAVGLAVFALLPVAPPRLVDSGLVDTVTRQSHAYRVLQPPAFTDQYAAMPSLHVGWNLLITLAVSMATRRAWLRVLAVALTMSMDATVVLTANHFIFDALAGGSLASLSWFLAGHLASRRRPAVGNGGSAPLLGMLTRRLRLAGHALRHPGAQPVQLRTRG